MTTIHQSVPTTHRAMQWLLLAILTCAVLAPAASRAAFLPGPGPGPGPIPGALFQLYTIPGAFDNTAVNEGTEFFCTSLETAKIVHLGVDLRDGVNAARNPGANNGAIDIAPGQTVTIGTHDSPAFDEDVVLSLAFTQYPSDGSARIWSNSVKVMCSALLIRDDVVVGPRGPGADGPAPTGMVELKVVKAKFQTGD